MVVVSGEPFKEWNEQGSGAVGLIPGRGAEGIGEMHCRGYACVWCLGEGA